MPWPELVHNSCGVGGSNSNDNSNMNQQQEQFRQEESPIRKGMMIPLWATCGVAKPDDDSEDAIHPQIVTPVQGADRSSNSNSSKMTNSPQQQQGQQKQQQQQQQRRSFLSSFIRTPRAADPASRKQQHQDQQHQDQQQQQQDSSLPKYLDSAGSGNTNPNQAGSHHSSSASNSPPRSTAAVGPDDDDTMDRFWQQAVSSFWTSSPASATNYHHGSLHSISHMLHDACTACGSPDWASDTDDNNHHNTVNADALLGIAALLQPSSELQQRTHEEIEVSPSHHIQIRLPPQDAAIADGLLDAATTFANNSSTDQHRHHDNNNSNDNNNKKRFPNNNNKLGSRKRKTNNSTKKKREQTKLPLDTFEVQSDAAAALERSISELTMRSSYAAAHAAAAGTTISPTTTTANTTTSPPPTTIPPTSPLLPDKSRRMAYYAVGKHHRSTTAGGRGGNRRCYFTGKLILSGAPFYAGSVQQGLRTLVVFCLPSAVNLPEKEALLQYTLLQQAQEQSSKFQQQQQQMGQYQYHGTTTTTTTTTPRGGSLGVCSIQNKHRSSSTSGTILSVQPGSSSIRSSNNNYYNNNNNAQQQQQQQQQSPPPPPLHMDTARGLLLRGTGRSGAASVASKSLTSKISRLSSLDDMSLSIEGDLDPNWGLDRDVLLAVLPPAGPHLLQQMADHYPEQFETLPMQVREPDVWKLYVKFCFFSGLPIAEGELHYKVADDIAEAVYSGEEIALSHDVMEAATGKASAEILALPNRVVLNYIRKHYPQQCSKLDDRVFCRASWERVAPEV